MASPAVRPPLTRPEVETACRAIYAGAPLPGVYLQLNPGEEAGVRVAQCYLVRQRDGGFMVAAPAVESVQEHLSLQTDEEGGPVALEHAAVVAMETTRGRRLGDDTVLLLDLPWEAVGWFTRAHPLRGALALSTRLTGFVVGGANARPISAAALAAAQAWIAGAMEDLTAREYTTAEEGEEEELRPALDPTGGYELGASGLLSPDYTAGASRLTRGAGEPQLDGEPMPTAQAYQELLDRLARLESERAAATGAPGLGLGRASAAGLFDGPAGALSPEELEHLRSLAGTAPRRTATGLRQGAAPRPEDPVEGALAESAMGALPALEVEDPLSALTPAATLSQILTAQLQQNALLMERLAARTTDPLQQVLSGSGGASGSDGSSVKGCVAREAVLKQITDLAKVAKVAETAALAELGLTDSTPGLMKSYIERIPWNDHKLLGHVAVMAASGWETGHRTGNVELQGFCSRLLLFSEQSALDNGRLPLAWLLGGYPEPSPAVFASRKRTTLKPFSRLSAPAWVAANLAYLRDLDWIETRMSSTAKGRQPGPPEQAEEAEAEGPRKPRRRGGGRGTPNTST